MANDEDALIQQAMIDTEKEIAGDAWGQADDVTEANGDHSLEEMGEGLEGQVEPDEVDEDESDQDESETTEAGDEQAGKDDDTKANDKSKTDEKSDDDASKGEAKADDKNQQREPDGRVPPGRLREASERARAAEAERDVLKTQLAEAEAKRQREIDSLNAKLDGVLAAFKQGQQPRQDATTETKLAEVPDIFDDPKGFAEHLTNGFKSELAARDQRLEDMRVGTSLQIAHATHRDAFTKAYDAVSKLNPQNPDDRATVQRIYASANPGEALVAWHKRIEALREVGDDPAAYREKIAKEARDSLVNDPDFRKQLLDQLREEAGVADNGKPNNVTRLPPSLNGMRGGNSTREAVVTDDSDEAIAASAWR